MSLVVSKLPMPANCFRCFASHWYDFGGDIVGFRCGLLNKSSTVVTNCQGRAKRRDDCPLKPLSQPSDKPLSPFERNELEKAMLGRGVEYETIQLILSDFDARIEHLRNLWRTIDEW